MPSLTDIAASVKRVEVRGVEVLVPGISARSVANLLGRFEELRLILTGRATEISADKLTSMAPDIVAAVIAAGIGMGGDEEAELMAESLPVGTQLELIEAILEVTFPGGVGPFAERLAKLSGDAASSASVASGRAQATRSPAQSRS